MCSWTITFPSGENNTVKSNRCPDDLQSAMMDCNVQVHGAEPRDRASFCRYAESRCVAVFVFHCALHPYEPSGLLGTGEGGRRGKEGEREVTNLSIHCHHHNDSCMKMGNEESHFNVSLIARDKATRRCLQTTIFLKRKKSRSGIEPRSFCLPFQPPANYTLFQSRVCRYQEPVNITATLNHWYGDTKKYYCHFQSLVW